MAPEVIKENDYDTAADIWSLGITAIELAKGHPYSQMHALRVLFLIPKNPAPALEGSNFSKNFKDFVRPCLHKRKAATICKRFTKTPICNIWNFWLYTKEKAASENFRDGFVATWF